MALRRAKPVRPRRPHPSPHTPGRTATPAARPKPPILKTLSNLATLSGGTQPAGQQQQDPNAPPAYESDPILQQIKALSQQNVAAAEASALAARQQRLIEFGYSPELDPLFGGDAGVSAAAKANPFSVLENLKHGHEGQTKNINEGANSNNLWWSSTRGDQLNQEGRSYLGQQANARGQLDASLGAISGGLLEARRNEQDRLASGNQDAYNRWLDTQLQYGLGGTPSAPAPAPSVLGGRRARPATRYRSRRKAY